MSAARLLVTPALCLAVVALSACGASAAHHPTVTRRRAIGRLTTTRPVRTATAAPVRPKQPPPPPYPQLLPSAQATGPTAGLVAAVRWDDRTAAWVERTPTYAAIAFDQRLVELHLHSGTVDAGSAGWRYGPAIAAAELPRLVAAFNGGFRLSTGAGGFEAYGRVAVPLAAGLGSIVTYADGTTDIGRWREGLPALGKRVVSVRQNLTLLVDQGAPAPSVDCVSCWGATLGGVIDPARSALGITATGRLVWVAGEHLTAAQLAGALVALHVVRAVELDINPEWVAGYFYGHRGGKGRLAPVAALPAQTGIPGQFLVPWSRDFFAIVAR